MAATDLEKELKRRAVQQRVADLKIEIDRLTAERDELIGRLQRGEA
jgi:hypothetical protein